MKKIAITLFCILLGFCSSVRADTITLRNINKDIDIEVMGVTSDHVNVVIEKKALKSLNIQLVNDKNYPDAIFLVGTDAAIECKIKEITEDVIAMLIPTSMISSLHMTFFPSDDKNKQLKMAPVFNSSSPAEIGNNPKTSAHLAMKEEKKGQMQEDYRFGSEIPKDIIEDTIVDEIRTSGEKADIGKDYRLKLIGKKTKNFPGEKGDRIELQERPIGNESVVEEEELLEDEVDEGNLEQEKPLIQDRNLGAVEGKIFHSGKPLADCQVSLQRLEKGGLLSKGYRPIEGATEYVTITNKDGIYRFANVPPGLYKLYWRSHSEETWVRRFKMEPDVIVEANKLTNPKVIETLKRTLN
jgi:hypothetical protein